MFRRNDRHRQADMFGSVNELPAKSKRRLEESWAGAFYRDFFCRIDESLFAELYPDEPSRPNIPVNVLVGFEVLKAGHGWTDEQAHDAVCFDLQVRHALGIHRLSDEVFTLRTVYNFRRALVDHATRTGTNLFETVFEQVTGEQQAAYEIASRELRMDSTQVASNIRRLSRLQLLVAVLQRLHRELDEGDRRRLEADLAPYCKVSPGQYSARLSIDEAWEQMQGIGLIMGRLVTDLQAKYAATDGYRVLRRAFHDHFVVVGEQVVLKSDHEISARSMQSPEDQEATFRRKAGRSYRGYVANVTETCDKQNDLQLIVDVAVEPNCVDDGQMLVDGVEDLAARTDVEKLYTDGGYNGPQMDETLDEHSIEQYQTGIRGGKARGKGRGDFDWEVDDEQRPVAVTCPSGQNALVERGRKSHTFTARFEAATCNRCPHRDECPAKPAKRRPERVLRTTRRQLLAARRVRRSALMRASGKNPRAAVEATIWSVKAPFPRSRVPYRGQVRVAMYTIASAAMVNVRRIATAARVQASADGPSAANAFHGALSGSLCLLRRLVELQCRPTGLHDMSVAFLRNAAGVS